MQSDEVVWQVGFNCTPSTSLCDLKQRQDYQPWAL